MIPVNEPPYVPFLMKSINRVEPSGTEHTFSLQRSLSDRRFHVSDEGGNHLDKRPERITPLGLNRRAL